MRTQLQLVELDILRLVNGVRSQLDIAKVLDVQDANYGLHVAVSRRVPALRKKGYLKDVAIRCECCKSALTRGHKNSPLELTEKGKRVLA